MIIESFLTFNYFVYFQISMNVWVVHAKMMVPVLMVSISTYVHVNSDSKGYFVNLVSSLSLHTVVGVRVINKIDNKVSYSKSIFQLTPLEKKCHRKVNLEFSWETCISLKNIAFKLNNFSIMSWRFVISYRLLHLSHDAPRDVLTWLRNIM